MKLRIAISYADGRREVVPVSAKVEVLTERKFGMALHECRNHEQFYYIGWEALRAAGKESQDFDDFLDHVSDVELLDAEQAETGG